MNSKDLMKRRVSHAQKIRWNKNRGSYALSRMNSLKSQVQPYYNNNDDHDHMDYVDNGFKQPLPSLIDVQPNVFDGGKESESDNETVLDWELFPDNEFNHFRAVVDDDEEEQVIAAGDYQALNDRLLFQTGIDYLNYLREIAERKHLPADFKYLFHERSLVSKGNAAIMLNGFAKRSNLTTSSTEELLNILHKLLPTANLPARYLESGKVVSELDDYVGNDWSQMLVFDCCPCGGTVYVGEDSGLSACTKCRLPRCTPCKRCGSIGACGHISQRTAQKVMHYRPFTSILLRLLETKGFVSALNYHYCDQQPGCYRDVSDGDEYIKQTTEMHEVYEHETRVIRERGYAVDNIIEISIVLGFYYDGAQLFKKRAVKFAPIVASILNLPFNFRTVVGAGMFLLGINTFSGGSRAETFLIRDCFVKEMHSLYYGVHLPVAGKHYFIQVRPCLHGYDTRALQPMLCVHVESKTAASCPLCFKVNNYLTKHFPAGTIEGDRCFLPLDHVLRSFGQSLCCCPRDWYRRKQLLEEKDYIHLGLPNHMIYPRSIYQDRGADEEFDALQSCELSEAELRQTKIKLKSPEPMLWYHKDDVDFVYLRDNVYYAHLDYRAKVDYARVDNQTYLDRANEALRTKISTEEGVYASWLFAILEHSNVATQVCWDPFHCFLNICRYVLFLWKGKRPVTPASVEYCKHTQTHPELYTEGDRIPWLLPPDIRTKIEDAIARCIIIPTGYTQHFQFKNKIFTQGSILHGTATIQVTTILMEFIVWYIRRLDPTYASPYLAYHLLLSRDLQFLQRTSFTNADIEVLQNRINELVALRTSLYPPQESHLVYHQLVDIVAFLKQFGPVRGWWTLPMERLLSVVKKGLPQGGSSHWITMMKRHVAQEHNTMDTAYDFTLSSDPTIPSVSNPHSLLSKGKIKGFIFEQDGIIQATDRAIMLRSRLKHCEVTLTGRDKGYFIEALLERLEEMFSDSPRENLLCRSCLYRLYSVANCHMQKKVFNGQLGRDLDNFEEWLNLMNENAAEFMNVRWIIDKPVPFHEPARLLETIHAGYLYRSDFLHILNFWAEPIIVYEYQQAIIYGIHFRSRGMVHRERNADDITTLESNNLPLQFLSNCRKNFSSWFTVHHRPTSKNTNSHHVGQFNFFFRVQVPTNSDPFLDNMPMASVVMRNAERETVRLRSGFRNVGNANYETRILRIQCEANLNCQSYDHIVRYIPLTQVCSTAIATIPLELNSDTPISNEDIQKGDKTVGSLLSVALHMQRVESVKFEFNKMGLLYHNAKLDDNDGLPISADNDGVVGK